MLDLANYHRLQTSVTIRELFELQDVAVCEGDMRWQQAEFRREGLQAGDDGNSKPALASATGRSNGSGSELTPSQAQARSTLLGGLPGLTADAWREAAALTRQAGKAGITFEQARLANEERIRARPPVRVGRRARRAESEPSDGN